MPSQIKVGPETIARFCRRNGIARLSFFGSVLRSDFRPDSDVDVLVEFVPGRTPGYFTLASLEEELASILRVKKVDLRTPRELSRYFRDEVMAGAEVQYEAG